MLLGSLGIINAEALWDARPSAYPASVALAVSYTLAMLSLIVANPDAMAPLLAILVASGVVVVPVLRYLRAVSRQFWPRAGARVPAAPTRVPAARP